MKNDSISIGNLAESLVSIYFRMYQWFCNELEERGVKIFDKIDDPVWLDNKVSKANYGYHGFASLEIECPISQYRSISVMVKFLNWKVGIMVEMDLREIQNSKPTGVHFGGMRMSPVSCIEDPIFFDKLADFISGKEKKHNVYSSYCNKKANALINKTKHDDWWNWIQPDDPLLTK